MSHVAAGLEPLVCEHLEVSLSRLTVRLKEHTGGAALIQLDQQLREIESQMPDPLLLPMLRLRQRLGLDDFHLDALLLAAAPEIAPALCPTPHQPLTGSHILDLLCPTPGARLRRIDLVAPGSPLIEGKLISLIRSPERSGWPALLAPLRVTPCWLAFLRGRRQLGELASSCAVRLSPLVAPEQVVMNAVDRDNLSWVAGRLLASPPPLHPESQPEGRALARGAAILLSGEPGCGKTLLCKSLAASHERPLLLCEGPLLVADPRREEILQDLCAQAQFFDEILVLRRADALAEDRALLARLRQELQARRVLCLLTCRLAGALEQELDPVIVYRRSFGPAAAEARQRLWQVNVPPGARLDPDVDLAQLAWNPLSGQQVAKAIGLAARLSIPDKDGQGLLTHAMLETCAGEQIAVKDSTPQAEVSMTFEQMVLNEEVLLQLRGILDAARVRKQVLEDWGFRRIIHRGTGLTCLFDGEPGTGKTLSAEIIARELQRNLRRVNVGTVVDKYIGETEKNLARIFREANPDRDVLLFDEADALFSKRTEVSRAVDRYSNMEINALLQLVERYEGIVILTTNLKERMDPAFERRLTFKVTFPMPDEDMRVRLWTTHLPPSAPVADGVDMLALAQDYDLSGGAIKNAVLKAAYAAASQGGVITHAHLGNAACYEAVAAGRLVYEETR